MNSIDIIDNYFEHYKLIKYEDSNLEEPIELYHKWYDAALELFTHYFQAGNKFYDKFSSVDNSGNGFVLHQNFNAVRGAYIVLSNKIKSIYMGEEVTNNEFDNKRVFIVHGHDEVAKLETARLVEGLGLEAIILNEKSNNGRTLIEKLLNYSCVGFAIILYTPCDKFETTNRARQNVVLEHGYFIGKIGRNRTFVLRKGNVEMPSDINGIVYETMDDSGVWKYKLAKELQSLGYSIDYSRIK